MELRVAQPVHEARVHGLFSVYVIVLLVYYRGGRCAEVLFAYKSQSGGGFQCTVVKIAH